MSQILRNFISNALKFTERGEVRVSRAVARRTATVVFAVADTGIGIAPEDQERIFEEFTQVDSPVQQARARAPASACRCRASSPSSSAGRLGRERARRGLDVLR